MANVYSRKWFVSFLTTLVMMVAFYFVHKVMKNFLLGILRLIKVKWWLLRKLLVIL